MTKPMPAIFFGHGNPMNALTQNAWTEGWASIGKNIPRPRAVLCVSAHWYLPATLVTAMPTPRTIHDFGGFPRQLHEVQYPAPGDPELARVVQSILAPISVNLDERWGLDHGTWSVLCHVFPDADVPVIQLSIDETQPAEFHYETAKRLTALRDEGVLIAGSGNLVHNLHEVAAACDKHAFVAQGGQSLRGFVVEFCRLRLVDAELNNRHVCVREHVTKHGPCAVVQAPSLIQVD